MKQNNILDLFLIIGNDERKQWEFTPKIDGIISYTVPYSEADNKADACICVWKAIRSQEERGILK